MLHSWLSLFGFPRIPAFAAAAVCQMNASLCASWIPVSHLYNESMVISYNHGNEYANIIRLIGSYSFLPSHSTDNSFLFLEKQRN